jgi:tetratricopeptide (TPR) repeat protein
MIVTSGCAVSGLSGSRVSECGRISGLSRAGEHKPAVDAADRLEKAGIECPDSVWSRVETSRMRLNKADAYVHKALLRKKEGNFLSARANLERALSAYPKYYWAQKLLDDVQRCIENEVMSLKSESDYLESRGDLPGALERIQEAGRLAPEDAQLRKGIVRLQAEVEQSRERSRIRGILEKVKSLADAERFEEAERVLSFENSPGALGEEGEELLRQIRERRTALVTRRLAEAIESEQKGDLDAAADNLSGVLVLVGDKDLQIGQAVEFARLLGMKFYSAGRMSKARDLWVLALEKDPGNEKMKRYIEEVNLRLEKLEKLKIGEGGGESQ